MTPLLEIAGITHRFGGLLALDAVDMRVEAGEIRALIGPNGAGKTTLLNILCGIHQPESGHVRFGGEDLLGLKPNQVTVRGLARTFQNIRVFTTLSVGENVMVAQHCRRPLGFWHALFRTPPFRREESEIGAVAQECLDFVGLAERRHEGAVHLPYGQKRLLEIARALATRPRMILLDEPAAGMNESETEWVVGLVRRIRDRGITVLLIEHNMRFVTHLADRITVLDFGRKIADGPPEAIVNDETVIEAYLGREEDFAEI